jgi:hypothetical protein
MIESNGTVVVDVDLKESDLQRANFWFRLGKWSTRLLLITLLLIGLLFLSRIQFSKIIENPIVATPLIVLIVFPILYPVLIWTQTKRGFANLQEFQRNVQYALSADGYKVSDPKSSAHIGWDTIWRAVEAKHSFHLFFHKSLFHTIPKRCFRQPEDIDRLRTILKHSLGARATVFAPADKLASAPPAP